jgi:hypothetical protein
MTLTSRASRAVLEANARGVAVEGVAADLVDPVLDLDRLCAGHVPHGVDDVDPVVPERRRHARDAAILRERRQPRALVLRRAVGPGGVLART